MNKKIGNLFTILGIIFFIGVPPVVFAVLISILLSKIIPISKSGLFFIIIILANIFIFLAKLLANKPIMRLLNKNDEHKLTDNEAASQSLQSEKKKEEWSKYKDEL